MGEISSDYVNVDGSEKQHGSAWPVANPTLPYWRTQLHPIDSYHSSERLPPQCDIAIIGAGMSGVATAYHIVEQHKEALAQGKKVGSLPSIVILEARQVCSGATGRNGGHSKVKITSIFEMLQRLGPEKTMEQIEFIRAQVPALKKVVDKEKLDCEFELRRSFDVFIDDKQAKEVEEKFKTALEEGQPWTKDIDFIGKQFAEQITSIKGAKAAFSSPACSLWPYKFVSQLLARLVERKEVRLYTSTPVTTIWPSSSEIGTFINTDRGGLHAKKVIFATNGYTGGLLSSYKDVIVPYIGEASHLSPQKPISPHLTHTYNIVYTPDRVDYLNPRPDGGIVVGGGKWNYADQKESWYNNHDDSQLFESARPHFAGLMQKHFRGWEHSGSQLDKLWTGVMGLTPDSLPHIGRVPGSDKGQYILAGYNGGGMAFIFLCAQGLAKLVMDDEACFCDTGIPRQLKTSSKRMNANVDVWSGLI